MERISELEAEVRDLRRQIELMTELAELKEKIKGLEAPGNEGYYYPQPAYPSGPHWRYYPTTISTSDSVASVWGGR